MDEVPVVGIRCIVCRRALRHQRVRHVLRREHLVGAFGEYILDRINPQEIADNNQQLVCHRCWVAAGRAGEQNEQLPVEQENVPVDDDQAGTIRIPAYRRAANTARRCIFGNDQRDLVRIPVHAKRYMLVTHNYYIPINARICQHHLSANEWLQLLNEEPIHHFTAEAVTDMLNTLKEMATSPLLAFDDVDNMEADMLHFWTGVTHQQFNTILEETQSIAFECRRPKSVLGIYLCKLRTGEPNERLAEIFRMTRRSLERKLAIARRCLLDDFVPRHLGFDHITRDEVVRRNLTIPSGIYAPNGNKAIIILDGTYIYLQKSSNFLFQKKTYSLHKFANLLKPFLYVCSDGYIVDVSGPHAATSSDATIMRNVANNMESPLHWLLQENDILVLDRGFRDSLPALEVCGYEVHMPATKNRGDEQLSTDQANQSRLVTIVRWVVEVINGRFKRDFKLFRHEYFNRAVPHMMDDFRIAAALLNTYREPVKDNAQGNMIVSIINDRIGQPNNLADYVAHVNMNRQRAAFIKMEANVLIDFPIMEYNDLYLLALGSYQIKLAKSYCKEHLRENNGLYTIELHRERCPNDLGDFNIEINENTYLLRIRIQSRHIRRRIYYSYIIINPQMLGRNAIREYYCSCLTGRRTVGTCAHIMSIIWYLGFRRHENIVAPEDFLDVIIVDDDIYI